MAHVGHIRRAGTSGATGGLWRRRCINLGSGPVRNARPLSRYGGALPGASRGGVPGDFANAIARRARRLAAQHARRRRLYVALWRGGGRMLPLPRPGRPDGARSRGWAVSVCAGAWVCMRVLRGVRGVFVCLCARVSVRPCVCVAPARSRASVVLSCLRGLGCSVLLCVCCGRLCLGLLCLRAPSGFSGCASCVCACEHVARVSYIWAGRPVRHCQRTRLPLGAASRGRRGVAGSSAPALGLRMVGCAGVGPEKSTIVVVVPVAARVGVDVGVGVVVVAVVVGAGARRNVRAMNCKGFPGF